MCPTPREASRRRAELAFSFIFKFIPARHGQARFSKPFDSTALASSRPTMYTSWAGAMCRCNRATSSATVVVAGTSSDSRGMVIIARRFRRADTRTVVRRRRRRPEKNDGPSCFGISLRDPAGAQVTSTAKEILISRSMWTRASPYELGLLFLIWLTAHSTEATCEATPSHRPSHRSRAQPCEKKLKAWRGPLL